MNLNVWAVIVWYHNEYTQRDPSYMRIGAHSTHPSPFSRTTFALFSLKCVIAHDGTRLRVLPLLYRDIMKVKKTHIREIMLSTDVSMICT